MHDVSHGLFVDMTAGSCKSVLEVEQGMLRRRCYKRDMIIIRRTQYREPQDERRSSDFTVALIVIAFATMRRGTEYCKLIE